MECTRLSLRMMQKNNAEGRRRMVQVALERSAADPKDTTIYFWYLMAASRSVETMPSNTQSLSRTRDPPGDETVVNVKDGRKKVAEEHFKDKTWEISRGSIDNEAAWPIAIGWLVVPDVVVTVGHCAYDYSHSLGRLAKVRAYIEYRGQGDLSNTEARWGTAIAITCGADLGFVGHPGDIMDEGERGARMYEMFTSTTYNLGSSDQHMLQYKIDTYSGNSGSPVFNNQKSLVSIGVHIPGGYSYDSASVFDGRYGNRFLVLQLTAATLTTDKDHPEKATQPNKEARPWLWQLIQRTDESEVKMQALSAGMVEADKVIAPILAKLLYAFPSDLSFGPDAGPEISILAAAAIATAGRLAADSASGSDAESLAKTRRYEGIISHAVLAEAALQFYSSTTLKDTQKKKVWEFIAPFVLKVTPRLLKGALEPSFRLLLSRIAGKTTPDPVRSDNPNQQAELDVGFGRQLKGEELEFFDELMEYAKADEKSTESLYSSLITVGDFLGSAFKKTGPGPRLRPGRRHPGPTQTLAHRAFVAEACLQPFVQLRTELRLDRKSFTHFVNKAKAPGPKLVNVALYVVKLVGLIVGDILREIEKKKAAEKKQGFLDFSWGN
ncbi:hypothetical protein RRF57_010360 [Xylaria bambusicola]|uniref:Serine protease n=1 Tax=Xylaria bambusicola TaxID=326684 RepID=A0AAN7USA5_9PEZI